MSDLKSFRLSTGYEILDFPEDVQSKDQIPERTLIITSKPVFDHTFDFTFSKGQMVQLVDNFNKNVRGARIPVNYAHPLARGSSDAAAGWVTGLDLVEEKDNFKIYATINWNENGKKDVMGKKYLYTSVGVYLNYISPTDGKTEYGNVLYEVSLTNSPADVNIGMVTELSTHKRENIMSDDMKKQLESTRNALSLSVKQNKELSSKVDSLTLSVETMRKENKDAERKLELSERSAELERFIVDGRILPAVKEKALTLSSEAYEGFKVSLPDRPVYKKSPDSGKNPDTTNKGKDAEGEIIELASKLRKEDSNLSMTDSISRVMKDRPDLEKRYNQGA